MKKIIRNRHETAACRLLVARVAEEKASRATRALEKTDNKETRAFLMATIAEQSHIAKAFRAEANRLRFIAPFVGAEYTVI